MTAEPFDTWVAEHLEPGGRFVLENYVPELRRLPPGRTVHVLAATAVGSDCSVGRGADDEARGGLAWPP
jgi:hypothetical protein